MRFTSDAETFRVTTCNSADNMNDVQRASLKLVPDSELPVFPGTPCLITLLSVEYQLVLCTAKMHSCCLLVLAKQWEVRTYPNGSAPKPFQVHLSSASRWEDSVSQNETFFFFFFPLTLLFFLYIWAVSKIWWW